MENNDPPYSADTGRGAFVSHTYVRRDVKTYAVFESEVAHIALFNTLSTIGFSAGSAFLAFAVGIWTNWSFVEKDKLPPEGAIMSNVIAPGLLVLTVVVWGLAAWARWSRGSTWEAIKKESKSGQSG